MGTLRKFVLGTIRKLGLGTICKLVLGNLGKVNSVKSHIMYLLIIIISVNNLEIFPPSDKDISLPNLTSSIFSPWKYSDIYILQKQIFKKYSWINCNFCFYLLYKMRISKTDALQLFYKIQQRQILKYKTFFLIFSIIMIF